MEAASVPSPAEVAAPIPEGGRNDEITSVVGKLHRDGFSADVIRATAKALNQERCDPPLENAEIEKIVGSVTKYPRAADPHVDRAEQVLQLLLTTKYAGGRDIIYSPERQFWGFQETHWVPQHDAWVERQVLECIKEFGRRGSTSALIGQVMHLLKAQQAVNDDRLRFLAEPLPVINCLNGELWLDELAPVSTGQSA